MTNYQNKGFESTDYFLYYKDKNNQKDEIKSTLLKRRFSFALPIKYFNSLSNSIVYDLLFITCGIQNPTNDQKSIRLFLNDQSIFGEAMIELMKQSKSFNNTLHCINHTFLNIKTYELMSTLNDEVEYNSFDDLLESYDLEFKRSLTNQCDAYKLNNKMIVMLNDCVDLTDELKETNKFISVLKNNENEEDRLLKYLHESIYAGLVYHSVFFKHVPFYIGINRIRDGVVFNQDSYSHEVMHRLINSQQIMTNYEFLLEAYEKNMSQNSQLRLKHNNQSNNIQQYQIKCLSGQIENGENSFMMQLFNFKALNY